MTGDGDEVNRLHAELAAAQAELRKWKEAHERLANNSHAVFTVVDSTGRVTYVSPSVRKVLGFEPEALVGQSMFELVDPQDRAARRASFAAGIAGGAVPTVTLRAQRKDGSFVWMEYRMDTLRDEQGTVIGMQSISRDVTARREAEEALRRAEENFETFVRSMPVPAVVHRDDAFVLVNRAFTEAFGYGEAEIVGRSILDIVESADVPYVRQYVANGLEERAGLTTREHHLLHADGTRSAVEVTSVPVVFRGQLTPMAVIHDLRERKRLEAQLVMADRMASLGRLSAAVGHEINNPLAYILGSLTLIDRELAQLGVGPAATSQLHDLLGNVREGAERIRAVVQDLRALSREPIDARGPADLSHVLDLCTAMAEHELRHRARLVKAYAALPAVGGTEARLGQVFSNLLVNAAQAIPEGDAAGNEVRVEAHVTADGKVAVDVVDTGSGIAPEVVPRIFEPFFSTKAGAGTGLGLSISQHIVTSLGGTISATPNAPRGTRLRVVLPCADEAEAIESVRQEAARAETEAKNVQARILVVDDEPQITLMIARLLRPRAVDVAHGGKEAITRLSDGPRYDVILCDLHMNDLTGMDVYEHLQRAGGGLERRVIFMTGGVMSERATNFVAQCDCPLLDKPFDGAALESAIESVLARGSSS